MPESVRLDKWLWAARFYKTRTLAAEAVEGGKVEVNGEKVRRARPVRPGDLIRLRQGPFEYQLTVRALGERRGPVAEARALYEEDPDSRERREWLRQQHRLAPPAAKPTKRDRRTLRKLKGDR